VESAGGPDDLAADNREERTRVPDLVLADLEQVTVKHRDVCILAWLDGALPAVFG
jgi:hypothetical protein